MSAVWQNRKRLLSTKAVIPAKAGTYCAKKFTIVIAAPEPQSQKDRHEMSEIAGQARNDNFFSDNEAVRRVFRIWTIVPIGRRSILKRM